MTAASVPALRILASAWQQGSKGPLRDPGPKCDLMPGCKIVVKTAQSLINLPTLILLHLGSEDI